MGKCAFCGKLSNNKEKATLHRFPRDESSWKKWVKIIEREGWIPTQSSFLCSDHFTEESFCWYDNNRTKKRLKPGVLPMICSKIKFEPESDILSTNNCRDQLNSMSDSNKTSIVYENDESVEIKEEIIEERHQGGEHKFPSEKSKLDEKSISSGNKSAVKTEIVYESDGTWEIKEEIIPDQSNSMSDTNKSTGRLVGGTNSRTTTPTSSSNCSVSKTSFVYEYDESMEIKEEIIDERHHSGEHNLLSEKNQLVAKSISSDNKSALKTEIVYEYDETLEIKEEIIQDSEAVTGQKFNKKCEARWNTVNTREPSSLTAKKLRNHKKKKIQASEPEPLKKYYCRACARSYKYKKGLNKHKKFECGITPQFICKICDKRFKHRSGMTRHMGQVHQKTNSNQNKEKIQESKQEPEKKHNRHQKTNSNASKVSYNCDICFQSYSSLSSLYSHNRVKHAAVKPQFICDVCGYKTNKKCNMSNHISSRHFKNSNTSKSSYNCDKCFGSYSSLNSLKRHDRLKHAAVKPEFICDVCDYKANRKCNLLNHISSRHFKNSQARHNCDKCSQSYSSLGSLHYHNLAKHTAAKPKFICEVCGYRSYIKSTLSKHISFHHFKNSKTSQASYNCDKCSKKYSSLDALERHHRLKHGPIK